MFGQFQLIGVVALVAAITGFATGNHWRGVSDERDRLAAQADQRELAVKVESADTANTQASTARLDAAQPEQQKEIQYVDREVIRYVRSADHGRCQLPADWVRLYNQSNGLPGGVPASGAAGPQADVAAQRASGSPVPGLGHGGADRGDRQ